MNRYRRCQHTGQVIEEYYLARWCSLFLHQPLFILGSASTSRLLANPHLHHQQAQLGGRLYLLLARSANELVGMLLALNIAKFTPLSPPKSPLLIKFVSPK